MPVLPGGRKGYCSGCGFRTSTGDDRGGPSIQPKTLGRINMGGQAVPVEQARGVGRAFAGMVSGRLSRDDVFGRA